MRSMIARCLVAMTLLALAAVPAPAASPGWLGVTTQPTDEDLRRGLDLTTDGLIVNRVTDGSPAARAGVRKGDVILTYNWKSVTDPEKLRQMVRDTAPGRAVSLGLWRDGAKLSLQVSVGEVPSGEDDGDELDTPTPPAAPRAPRAPSPPHGETHRHLIIDGREIPDDDIDDTLRNLPHDLERMLDIRGLRGLRGWSGPGGTMMFSPSAMSRGRLGVRVEKLNSDLGQALGVVGGRGVLVTEVFEDTPAQKAGLKAGDVIVKVGADSVDTPNELVRALDRHDGKIGLTVLRKGVKREVQPELAARSEGQSYWWHGSGDSDDHSRNLEPGPAPRVYRWKTKDDSDDQADLREEIRQLKQDLEDLRTQMNSDKAQVKSKTQQPEKKQDTKK
jgi:S1-C subfamily serine protease